MTARASHYIVRPGPTTVLPSGMAIQRPGRLVPLVAVDQLPAWLDIVGVPRVLSPAEALHMVAIGGYDDRLGGGGGGGGSQAAFEVRILQDLQDRSDGNWPPVADTAPTTAAAVSATTVSTPPPSPSGSVCSASSTSTTCSAAQLHDASIAREAHARIMARGRQQELTGTQPGDLAGGDGRGSPPGLLPSPGVEWGTWTAAGYSSSTVRSSASGSNEASQASSRTASKMEQTKMGDGQEKKACRFWCHTGHCHYGNVCKFAHTMPMTLAGLQDVRLEGLPAWWIREVGLDSPGIRTAVRRGTPSQAKKPFKKNGSKNTSKNPCKNRGKPKSSRLPATFDAKLPQTNRAVRPGDAGKEGRMKMTTTAAAMSFSMGEGVQREAAADVDMGAGTPAEDPIITTVAADSKAPADGAVLVEDLVDL